MNNKIKAQKKKYRLVQRMMNIPDRLKTAPGRQQFLHGAFFRTWRFFFPLAGIYRRMWLRRIRLAAVVGSFGKTTTARAVYAALGLSRRVPRGWNAGSPLAVELLRIHPNERCGVLEVGISGKKMMARCARFIKPDIVVVTSIGSEHHRSLGTLAETRNEKADMVRALPLSGLAVLNGDDPNVLWMRGETKARVLSFGFSEACDVRASSVVLDIRKGMRFTLHADGMTQAMSSSLIGRHQVYSILAAVAVAVGESLPLDEVLPRLQRVAPAPGRLEVVPLKCGAFLLDDSFKAVFETVAMSLDTLAELHAQRKIVVLGDIEDPKGPQGPQYKNLGARLARLATRVVFVGGAKAYVRVVSGAVGAGMSRGNIVYAGRSPRRAAEIVLEDLGANDIVLIKGRSTQQLERVAFQLAGKTVPCDKEMCQLKPGCADCPEMKRARGF